MREDVVGVIRLHESRVIDISIDFGEEKLHD
jgi:hypothetical protein